MTNIDIRFTGYANFKQVKAELASLQAQFNAVNAAAQKSAFTNSSATKAAAFAQERKAVESMGRAYQNAAASTGMFDVSSHRVKSHTQEFVNNIQKQRLGIKALVGDMATAKLAYREQLRLQGMSVTQFSADKMGNPLATLTVPRDVAPGLDTIGRRMGFISHLTASAAQQAINWGKNMQWSGRQLSMGFTMPLVALGALSAKTAYDMDKNFTQTAKVYDTYATTAIGKEKEINRLRKDSVQLSATVAKEYGISAKDTLDAQSQLAATGQRGNALMEGTKEALRLASLGSMDYNKAVSSTIALQAVFKMSSKQLADTINYMNSVENATSLTMEDFVEATPIAAAQVRQLGGSVKDLGTMLVAMKERGVPATEAANAIKASMTRLYRPSKRVREEFQMLTGKSLPDLVKGAKGQLIPTVLAIAESVEGLDNISKTRALSGLFGTEQSGRLRALMEGLLDMKAGIGQTAKAAEVANASNAANAKTAAREMAQQQKSLSGQLKRNFEALKVALFPMGEVFLKLAGKIVGGFADVAEGFNALPSGLKKITAYVAVAIALAGPLLMLIGLTANLVNQGILFASNAVQMATGFKMISKEQMAAKIAAEASTKATAMQIEGTRTLTMQIQGLTNSLREATAAKTGFNTAMAGPAAAPTLMGKDGRPLAGASLASKTGKIGQATSPSSMSGPMAFGASYPKSDVMAARERTMARQSEQLRQQEKLTSAQAKAEQKLAGQTARRAMYMGAMTVSMGAMLLAQNETQRSAAQWLMIFSIAGPILSGVVGKVQSIAKAMAAARLASSATGKSSLGIKAAMAAGLKSMNPWVLGLVAAGAAAFVLWKHLKKAKQEFNDTWDDSKKLGKILGFTPKASGNAVAAKEGLNEAQKAQAKLNAEMMEQNKMVGQFKSAYPGVIDSIKKAKSDQEKFNIALVQGIKVIDAGGSAKNAEDAIRIALIAAQGVADGERIEATFGFDMDKGAGLTSALQAQIDGAMKAVKVPDISAIAGRYGSHGAGFSSEQLKRFESMGKAMGIALKNGLNLEGKAGVDVFQAQQKNLNAAFAATKGMINGEKARKNILDKLLTSYGVEKQNRKDAITEIEKGNDGLRKAVTIQEALNAASAPVNLGQKRRDVVGLSFKFDKNGGDTTGEDMTDAQAAKLSATYAKVFQDSYGSKAQKEAQAIAAVNAQLQKMGFLVPLVAGMTGNLANQMESVDIGANSAARAVEEASSHIKDILSQSATYATNKFAERAMSSLEASHSARLASIDAASAAASNRLDARSAALDARHKAQNDAMEARSRRNQAAFDKRWKNRKDKLQAEEDLRKRIFEAEKNRIQRLNELHNSDVDYRVALNTGNLDEAAKIRSEQGAKKTTWGLEDSETAAAAKAEAAMKRLEAAETAARVRFEKAEAEAKARLERTQARQKAALEAERRRASQSVEIARAAENKKYETQKAAMERALEYIKGRSPANKKALTDDINYAAKTYGVFQGDLAVAAKNWDRDRRQNMADLTWAALKDIKGLPWKASGQKILKDFMAGSAGGISEKDLINYMKTGKLKITKQQATDFSSSSNPKNLTINHGGGLIGSGGGTGRGGYPARSAPHPSEKLMLAQKNEYVIKKKAVKAVGTKFLDMVNNQTTGEGGADWAGFSTGQSAMRRTQLDAVHNEAFTLGVANYKTAVKIAEAKAAAAAARAAAKALGGAIGANGADKSTGGPWTSPWRGHHTTRNGHDWNTSSGTALYAPHSGTASGYDIRGHEPRAAHGGLGYRSYGRVIKLNGGGKSFLFGHNSARKYTSPTKVKAGAFLGRTGNTGNSSGPHVHIELNGSQSAFGPFMRSKGVRLKTGGTVKYDNTIANLHRDEQVLTAPLTSKLQEGIDNFAQWPSSTYNLDIHVHGNIDTQDIPKLAKEIKKEFDKDDSRYGKGKKT